MLLGNWFPVVVSRRQKFLRTLDDDFFLFWRQVEILDRQRFECSFHHLKVPKAELIVNLLQLAF